MLWPPAVLAVLGLLVTLLALASPVAWLNATHSLAVVTHLKDPAAGAAFLARTAPPLAARFCGLLLAGCFLAAAAARRQAVSWALFAAACADLAITNAPLNITMEAGKLAPPSWYVASAGPQRVYVGGRFRGYMNGDDPDGVPTWQIPAEAHRRRRTNGAERRVADDAVGVGRARGAVVRPAIPLAGGVRGHAAPLRAGGYAGTSGRFLRRTGVRRCVLPATESRQFRVVADVPDWNMRVFECNPGATRVLLAGSVVVAPDGADIAWQREALFDPFLTDNLARLERQPQRAGLPGAPTDPSVRIVHDGASAVVLVAALRENGILVLRDTFDPSWRATVDGLPAEIVRANGLLPRGRASTRTARDTVLVPATGLHRRSEYFDRCSSWFCWLWGF